MLGPEPADIGSNGHSHTNATGNNANCWDGTCGSELTTHVLDTNITEDEVLSALKKMHKGKAAGVDGITTELLLIASDVLLPHLTRLFNSMFSGEYPDSLSTGILHPIFKSGDTNSDIMERNEKLILFFVDLENESIINKNKFCSEEEK